MAPTLSLKPCIPFSASSSAWSQSKMNGNLINANFNTNGRMEVQARSMLAPRKFMQRRRKVEIFKDAADEADQKNWRRLMMQIEEMGSAVSVLRRERIKNQALPRDLVLGMLVRFKQLKKWDFVSEILEWLQTQHWWDFSEMDYHMLITAYGKQGDFNRAESLLGLMNKKGYLPNVVSYTALMEAYGRGGQYNTAEAIFRRMLSSGPEPSALTYQIILKTFVQGNKFKEAEKLFETLLNEEKSPLKPDQKMFHMIIYMYRKAGNYGKARKILPLMTQRGVPQSTVTYNSLMSFETNYKEVSNIYDQMQRSGLRPDVVSYALLINAYGKARREEEALAVFESMLDAGVRPTHKAYNILLDAFAISGMVEQARIVFKRMRRDRPRFKSLMCSLLKPFLCTPDLCSYTTMLSAYVNASDMESAEKFFRRLKHDGLEPNVVTYGTLIKGYANVNNLEKMMETYEKMQSSGIKANQTIFTTIMDAYGRNKDFGCAVSWYKEMENNGISPDQKANNILMSLARTEDERQEASQLVGLGHVGVGGISLADKDYDDSDDEEEGAEEIISCNGQMEDLLVFNVDRRQNWEGLQSLNGIDL
ncbi:hypothetical protein K2173_012320 [Erythroxylum novogranatense]|uniref:Pentatricopeptide repeat-containing protein n=1 Tax=Erythroxylum novogranatense TaxID=1862640 RepID=A0AAV8SCB5_9ROSI|nr:hypothetical protein K2173_012320 [Erythroxylum novogranatense]